MRNKDLALAMYDADRIVSHQKTSKQILVEAFDYEKALICPKSKASVFYYKRKLNVSNFNVVDEGRYESTCYVDDVSIAAKGPNEVGSFVVDFIDRKVKGEIKEFRLYSDNCFAQNKNRGLSAALLHVAAKNDIKIRHRYLEKGHTYNGAGTTYSLTERKARPREIYTPEQWYDIIATSKRSKTNPINVVRVDRTMVLDWKSLAEKLNLDKDVDGKPIPWQKLQEITYDGSSPYELSF